VSCGCSPGNPGSSLPRLLLLLRLIIRLLRLLHVGPRSEVPHTRSAYHTLLFFVVHLPWTLRRCDPDSGQRQQAGGMTTPTSGLLFSLHPLVLINVSDHHTRVKAQANGVAPRLLGGLLGTQVGRTVEITNSFELLTEGGGDSPRTIDLAFLQKKCAQCTPAPHSAQRVHRVSVRRGSRPHPKPVSDLLRALRSRIAWFGRSSGIVASRTCCNDRSGAWR